MIQVYCNDESGVNQWLRATHGTSEVVDIKIAMNEHGEYIMVVYKENV